MRKLFAIALPAWLVAGCAAPPEGAARVEFDLPEQARALAAGGKLAAALHADALASIDLLLAAAPVPPHRHLESEEILYLLSGSGTLELGTSRRELRAGDLIVIPRNTPHGFTPTGSEPPVALRLFVPRFVEGDRRFEPEPPAR